MYKKYNDTWLVKLLFDDALDTNNWFVRERVRAPLGLMTLGSSTGSYKTAAGSAPGHVSCNHSDQNSGCMQAMQASRYESGQDNSPMYDAFPNCDGGRCGPQNGEFMNMSDFREGLVGPYIQMPLYDVGMTALAVSEAEALIELAPVINRTEVIPMLRARCATIRAALNAHAWSEQLGIYSNKFTNCSAADTSGCVFYPRISPTSFFPLGARAPSDDQAKTMMQKWLMDPTKFCVSPTGDSAGNKDTCYTGLPSISASDTAFPALGYWRGAPARSGPVARQGCPVARLPNADMLVHQGLFGARSAS